MHRKLLASSNFFVVTEPRSDSYPSDALQIGV
jgi:hypothetical protein